MVVVMSDLVWTAVSMVSITMLFVLFAVAGVPLILGVAGGLFVLSALVGVMQIGRE